MTKVLLMLKGLFNKCRVDFSLAHFFAQLILSDDERKRVLRKKSFFMRQFQITCNPAVK